MTIVVHCRRAPFDTYIGRAHQEFPASKWGNPFPITPTRTRWQALAEYETYLRGNADLMAALPELRDKVLGCWCKGTAPGNVLCHGDILAKLVGELDAKPASLQAAESMIPIAQEILAHRDQAVVDTLVRQVSNTDVLPVFASTYSYEASSILSLEEAGKTRLGNTVSICDLAREHHLKQVVLVDSRLDGFPEALRSLAKPFKPTPPTSVDAILKADENSKVKLTRAEAQKLHDEAVAKYAREKPWSTDPVQLIFGLKLTVVPDMAQKDDASRVQESTVIVFMKDMAHNPAVQSPSHLDLVRLHNRAWTVGSYKGQGRIDWVALKELWTPNLALALPFWSSFLSRNQLTFATIVPDLPCVPTVFKEIDSQLPFAHLIDEAVDRYVAQTGCPVQRVKSVYYAGTESSSFELYSIMRARENHGTLSSPKWDNLASDRFSFMAWKELVS